MGCLPSVVGDYANAADVKNPNVQHYEFQASRHEWLEKLWTAFGLVIGDPYWMSGVICCSAVKILSPVPVVQSALLVSSSVQPFSQPTSCRPWLGAVWGFTLLLNCFSLLSSVFALGCVLCLPKDAPVEDFVRNLGCWVGLPAISTIAGAFMFVAAVVCSSWCMYFYKSAIAVTVAAAAAFLVSFVVGCRYRQAADSVLGAYKNSPPNGNGSNAQAVQP